MNKAHQKPAGESSTHTHEGGYSVLVVDGSIGHAQMVRMMLSNVGYPKFNIECVDRFSDAMAACATRRFEGCILDLDLPDSKGIDTLMRFSQAQPDLAIVVLAAPLEESLGALLIKYGAQDEIAQDGMTAEALARTVTYAIERKRSLSHSKKAEPAKENAESSKEIDDLKQALQQSRETFSAFFRGVLAVLANNTNPMESALPAMSIPMIMVDEACVVQEISDSAAELFGVSAEQSVGKKINDVLQFGKEKALINVLQKRRQISFPLLSVVACRLGVERKFVSAQISPFGSGAILLFIDQTPLVVSLDEIRSELLALLPE
jgi:DNA-binding NarL/FixJ family response regulator